MLTLDGQLIKSVDTGAGALALGFNSAKNLIYVSNRRAGTTTIIDGKTYVKIADLQTGTHPQTIAVDEKTGRVWVTNKAKSGPRPAAGQPAPPPVDDRNGDVVNVIEPK